jgi:hypothetical protein
MIELPSPLAVVCHDAGAANLILPWLERLNTEVRPMMAGPARVIWERRFAKRPLIADLSEALRGSKALLSGTGWASTLEHDARAAAARLHIPSVAVLDHWVNYRARFERVGICQLPDEIWVVDEEAAKLARSAFPNTPVRLRANLYVEEQLARIGPPPGRNRVLYVLEPVRANWGRSTAGEFQALDYAIEHLPQLGLGEAPLLVLRPHPSETEEKYRIYAQDHSFVSFDRSSDLAAAVTDADAVIGVESFALTIALQAGRPAFSSLPPWAPEIRLPHQGIKQIRSQSPIDKRYHVPEKNDDLLKNVSTSTRQRQL